VNDVVKVACVQAEPVAFDRTATIDKLEGLAAEAAGAGARLALFPETFIPVYPSNRWVRYLAGWGGSEAGAAREVFARLMQQSVTVPGPDSDRLAEIARANDLWLAVGVNELDGGTIYNSLLVYSPAGELALHHRKLMPTNHERLVWGLGDGRGLETIATDLGKVGGLICWENLMPLARYAVYRGGPQIWLAPTADDSDGWLASMRHIAIESGAFVVSVPQYIPGAAFPDDFPVAIDRERIYGRGGAAIVEPSGGNVIEGPLYDREGIVVADCDLREGLHAKRFFDAVGHYSRADVLLS
jgi:nitrilase